MTKLTGTSLSNLTALSLILSECSLANLISFLKSPISVFLHAIHPYVSYDPYGNGCWSTENLEKARRWASVYGSNDPDARDGMQLFDGYTFDSALKVMNENRLSDISVSKQALKNIADTKMPIWFWHAVNDETISFMHGVAPYEILTQLYTEAGLSATEISQLIRLNVLEDSEYFSRGIAERHQASKMVSFHPEMLDWLFQQSK